MKSRKLRSVDDRGVSPVEGRGDTQMRGCRILQAYNAVCEITKREIEICSKMAENEKRLWWRPDGSAFSERLKMLTKPTGLLTVKSSEWHHIPAHYLYPEISTGNDRRGCGDEERLRTPGGSTFTAIRRDGSRSTVVFVPLSSSKCLPRDMTETEEYVSVHDLKNMILKHLETGNNCLQIFSTETSIQSTNSITSCGSQATVVSNDSGTQSYLNNISCENQDTCPSKDCGSQAAVTTTSSGCQATVDSATSGIQASPKTCQAECQAASVMVDVACQTDPVETSDAQVNAKVDTLCTAVPTQDLVIISPADSEVEITEKYEHLSPQLFLSLKHNSNSQSSPSEHKPLSLQKCPHVSPSPVKMNDEIPILPIAALVDTAEHLNKRVTERERFERCDIVFDSCKQESLEYDVEDLDEFNVSENSKLQAMTEELKSRFGSRNELSLAEELAVALSEASERNDAFLHLDREVGCGHQGEQKQTVDQKTDSNMSVHLAYCDQKSYDTSADTLSIASICGAQFAKYETSFTKDVTVATSTGSIAMYCNARNNNMSLASELAMVTDESSHKREPSSEVDVPFTNTSPINSIIRESRTYDKETAEKLSIANVSSNGRQSFCNSDSQSNNITDDVMLRVFGFDPARSPFTVNGYPLLPSMTKTLEDLELPIIDKKEVEFIRENDGAFVSVGRGSYGCVYLAKMAGRGGYVVVKDYINEYVTWEVIQHEAQLLKYLSDTGFVPEFTGLIKSSASFAGYSLVQEYFGEGMTIQKVLRSKDSISKTTWIRICCQLANGLQVIHAKHVLLNDIKGDNVLVDLVEGFPKLRYIDVGMATYRQGLQFQQSRPHVDVYEYLAPEVCMGSHSSPLSDIYSLGHLLEEIACKTGIAELMGLSEACTNPLPIERMSLAKLRSQLNELLKVMEQEEVELDQLHMILGQEEGESVHRLPD